MRIAIGMILSVTVITAGTCAEIVVDEIKLGFDPKWAGLIAMNSKCGAPPCGDMVSYRIVNHTALEADVTIEYCDVIGSTGQVLSRSQSAEPVQMTPLSTAYEAAYFNEDAMAAISARMQGTKIRCETSMKYHDVGSERSTGPMRIASSGPNHGYNNPKTNDAALALACPDWRMFAGLDDYEEKERQHALREVEAYRGDPTQKLLSSNAELAYALAQSITNVDVSTIMAREAMVKRALGQGCQQLSDGTRMDVNQVAFVVSGERVGGHFFVCTANPCLWVDRLDVDGDFRETLWYRTYKQPQPLPPWPPSSVKSPPPWPAPQMQTAPPR